MDALFAQMPASLLVVCLFAALIAGLVKGVVGFAMPTILISLLSSLISPELALAGLILPTLLTNGVQALRQGPQAAVASVIRFRVFLGCGIIMLLLSAQLVRILPANTLLLAIGVLVAGFAALQLAGWRTNLPNGQTPRLDAVIGSFTGFIGGLSGIWGPPTVAYLTALNTEKREQMRIQGVIYGLGALALAVAHIASGILTITTAKLSLLLVIPALIGMWLGNQIQDRIDQPTFRKATLIVLLVAGTNLIRRAIF